MFGIPLSRDPDGRQRADSGRQYLQRGKRCDNRHEERRHPPVSSGLTFDDVDLEVGDLSAQSLQFIGRLKYVPVVLLLDVASQGLDSV